MQQYIGTKIIQASSQDRDEEPGYAVRYPDGYDSWSPRDVFEAAYQPMMSMSFGHALVLLKAGHRLARAGWNGKGMFIYYVPANSYPAQTGAAKAHFGADAMVPYTAYLAIKNVNDTVAPWIASQTDALAEDWYLVD